MIEHLEHRIQQALVHPEGPRIALYRELVQASLCFLGLGPVSSVERQVKIWRKNDAIPVWADRDPENGGFWIPAFCTPLDAAAYVSRCKLTAPQGQEFFWMSQKAQTAFVLLCHLDGFVGISLYAQGSMTLNLQAPLVKEMSQGKIPAENTPPIQ